MSSKVPERSREVNNETDEQSPVLLNTNYNAAAIKSNKVFTGNHSKSFEELMAPLNLVASANYKLT